MNNHRRRAWLRIGAYLLLVVAIVIGFQQIIGDQSTLSAQQKTLKRQQAALQHQQQQLARQQHQLEIERAARRIAVSLALVQACVRTNEEAQILAGLVRVSLAPAATSTDGFRARLQRDLALLPGDSVLADVIRQLLVATDGSGKSTQKFRQAFTMALRRLRPVDCAKIPGQVQNAKPKAK